MDVMDGGKFYRAINNNYGSFLDLSNLINLILKLNFWRLVNLLIFYRQLIFLILTRSLLTY